MRALRKQLTYSNVIASMALFIALGGASYAAIKLPANSVGSKQIKDGAVGSADVKNHALKAGDFKGGLPSGPRGPRGPEGERGAAAAKYWARIKGGATPSVISGSGGITVTRPAGGNAQVTFPTDVSGCAAALTVAGSAAGRDIRRTSASSGATIVVNTWIWTNVTTGAVETTTDAFDIAVFC
jgi:hypothetical protein